jgi:hypothetical protein
MGDSPFKKHRAIRRSPHCRFDRIPRLTGNSARLKDSLRGDTISPGKSLRRISIEPGACSQISGQLAVNFNSVGVDVVTVTSISYIDRLMTFRMKASPRMYRILCPGMASTDSTYRSLAAVCQAPIGKTSLCGGYFCRFRLKLVKTERPEMFADRF